MIDAETELAYSSEMEVELRAATVITVDNIYKQVQKSGSDKLKAQITCPYEVDFVLWQLGEKSLTEMQPHHKVLSTYY